MHAPPSTDPVRRPPLHKRFPTEIGALVVGGTRSGVSLWRFMGLTLARAFRGKREPGAITQQMYLVGNRSLLFIGITLGFISMVSVFQVCLQLNRVTGDLSKVGMELIKLMVHESAPALTAMMLCTRVGAGIAAEIGSMHVTEQIDALRMCDVDPIDYLLVPRFFACLFMTPVLSIFALVVAIGTGTAMAHYGFGVNPQVFVDFSAVAYSDLAVGLTKCFAFGATIPIVAGHCGMTTSGGSEGVGSATTRAVINCSLGVLIIDFILSVTGFMLFPPQVAR